MSVFPQRPAENLIIKKWSVKHSIVIYFFSIWLSRPKGSQTQALWLAGDEAWERMWTASVYKFDFNVFSYTKDPKKAAGRTLETIVEIITYYLLKTWELNDNLSIERRLEEYGNPAISHNVEYSLHPIPSVCRTTQTLSLPHDSGKQ